MAISLAIICSISPFININIRYVDICVIYMCLFLCTFFFSDAGKNSQNIALELFFWFYPQSIYSREQIWPFSSCENMECINLPAIKYIFGIFM